MIMDQSLIAKLKNIHATINAITHNSNLKPAIHGNQLEAVDWQWSPPRAEGRSQDSIQILEYILESLDTACDDPTIEFDFRQLAEVVRSLKNSAWAKAITQHHKGLKRRMEKLADRVLNKWAGHSQAPSPKSVMNSSHIIDVIHQVAAEVRLHPTLKPTMVGAERNTLAAIHWKWSHSMMRGGSYDSKITYHYILEHIDQHFEELKQQSHADYTQLKETISNLRESEWGKAVAHNNKDLKRRIDKLYDTVSHYEKEERRKT